MKKKMVIIGAGSSMFTQGLVIDLLRTKPGGHEWTIALCDIDTEVLDDVTRLIRKMLQAKGDNTEIISSADRCDVLPGADYVVSTIGVGGRRAWEQDVFIPRKYGIFQPVGDTAMPGGISRAMRMVPAMVAIVKDTKRLAPQAKFFNYSNPMAVICRALSKAVDFPVTGLCIGTIGSAWYIADTMGYDRRRVTSLAAGINHCTFLYDYRVDGVSVIEDIRKKIGQAHFDNYDSAVNDRFHGDPVTETSMSEPFAWSFFQKYSAFPAPGDRHITEFFTELFKGGAYYGKKLGVDAFSFEGTIAWGDKIHQDLVAMARSDQPITDEFFARFHGEHEQLISIIDSIERDQRNVYYVNLPNRGAIANLPPWAVVEMPAVSTAHGLVPMCLNNFPNHLASFTSRFLANIELTADAALNGDRRLMEEAILSGGYISDRNAVRQMTDELLKVHQADLPQFR